jgi:hypothetical protein
MRSSIPLLVAAAAASLSAQNYIVSPVAFTNVASNQGNTIPFWSQTHHYMQLHGDLRGTPRIMQGLSLRRAGFGTFATAVARTIDLELFMGPCNIANASSTFASNYTAPRTNVYTRKMTNLPDWVNPQGSPAPWSIVLVFDAPFVNTGQADLAWEALIHSTTSSGSYYADAYSGTGTLANVNSGTGCLATGRTAAMSVTARILYNANTDTFDTNWVSSNGIASVPTAILIGVTNPNLAIPGLCTNLYSSAQVVLSGVANASGSFTTPAAGVPVIPALKLHSQSACPDTGRTTGLPVSASQACESTFPARPDNLRRIWVNDVNATVGSLSETYPYSLITRFTHQ